jgi:hypothetical protein
VLIWMWKWVCLEDLRGGWGGIECPLPAEAPFATV